jgi:hypothetical protein
MKPHKLLLCAPVLALAGVVAAINFGCEKKPSSEPTTPPAPKIVSATKTSFSEVTSQLDPGGNFYLYLGTAQWLEGLSTKVGSWRQSVLSMPDLKADDTVNIGKAFDIVTHLIADSGVEDITGLGLSSVEVENGVFRNKAVMHHYSGKGNGFLWQFCGGQPHALSGLDYLPAETALACFSDMNLPLLWSVVQKEVAQADVPQAQQFLQQLPGMFEQQAKVKWDDLLKSLAGEFGFVITLDPTNNIPVPLPGSGAALIPTPGLLIAVKVNDDTIFNRIDEELKANEQVVRVDKPGLKMRTMPIPVPFVGSLRPTAATGGGYLFIASSDDLINSAIAVKSGQKPGLKAGDEFKHLAQGIPDRGNQFFFMSQRFAGALMNAQQKVITAGAGQSGQNTQWMQFLFNNKPAFGYSVGVNTPEGSVSIGNGSQSYANAVLLPAVAVPGLLAAIAIPNFVKARATSQQNACINNLRQLDAAENQFALENGKKTGEPCTMADLMPYLKGAPTCPAGGHYTIHPIGQSPTCSVPGHALE